MKLLKTIAFGICFMLLSLTAIAQNSTVQGTVVDDDGLSIPGATILLKNTNTGTITDLDGKFEIDAPADGVLVISFIGFETKEEIIGSRTNLDIILSTGSLELDEVVVVGYGTTKKSVVTGAISSIKQSEIEGIPITRIEQTLQGRVSGITIAANSGQPGSSSTIRIRGITTFGNNEPLWVVDGIVVDAGGIGYLNQSDIESIEVLKDAASQAIYGARAATGVILVTTKKGKSGKLNVSYSGSYGTSSPARKLNLLNGTEYATLMNEASVASGGEKLYANPTSYGEGTDWQDLIFNNSAKRSNHELSLSGGNENSTFYLSFGYLDQEGIVATSISNYTRTNARLNSTHKLTDKITFGQTLGYSKDKNIGLGNTNSEYGGPLASSINLDPITNSVITDPVIAGQAPYNNPGVFRDENGNPYGISSVVGQEMSNPLAYEQTRQGNFGWSDNFVGNAYLEIQPIEGLRLRSTIGGKLAYWGGNSFTPVSYLNASFAIAQNNISQSNNKGIGWNIENTISYNKGFGGHNLGVLLGQGAYVDNITSGSGVTYFDIPVESYTDASFNFSVPTEQISAYAYESPEHKVSSLFSRLTYDYKGKYLLTGIIRRDGSSRFGSNNKFGVFPSFSLGWVPSSENFWIENDVISLIKFRGGYGVTGNDAIGDFQYLSTIGDGRNYTIGNTGAVTIGNSPNAPSNPDLKWEETSQTNIGFDAVFFNDLRFTFDWFNKKTTGILQSVVIPGYVGSTGSPVGNVADMENRGIDLELGYRTGYRDFNFSFNGNASFLTNTVTYLGNGIDFLSGGASIQSSTYPLSRTQIGYAVNSFYGFKTDGIFQNQAEINAYTNAEGGLIQPDAKPGDFKWQDIDGSGEIDADDRDFLGSSIPKATFGFTFNMDYKNFDFLFFAQGASGNKIFQGLRRLDIGAANYQTTALGRWTGEGTSNDYPRLTFDDTNRNFNNPSDFYLEDGDYLRLKTLQIGYNAPRNFISRAGLENVRVYLTGENLITFTKYTGYDPEIGGGIFGIDRGFYPQAKSFMAGIKLQF